MFFEGRVFESHPLTIANAPSSVSCVASRSIVLGARVKGDWTRALNRYASVEQGRLASESGEKVDAVQVPVHVMIDGPYGGCGLDLGEYENVLLVAGGAGVTFTLGLLDDLVGRVVRHQRWRGERTRRVEFAWAIRSFGEQLFYIYYPWIAQQLIFLDDIQWFLPLITDIVDAVANSSLHLHISLFVTCQCGDLPPVPNATVTSTRPDVHQLLTHVISPTYGEDDVEDDGRASREGFICTGGVGVCASGPEGLTREAANAVARLAPTYGTRVGGIALHTEVFSL